VGFLFKEIPFLHVKVQQAHMVHGLWRVAVAYIAAVLLPFAQAKTQETAARPLAAAVRY
jgi:hypothetical protein